MYALNVNWNEAAAIVLLEAKNAERLSLPEISAASGIPVVSLQRYFAGTRAVSLDHFAAIARALGREPMDLFASVEARVQLNQAPDVDA
jgi:transcriptional regulator with XRE-family HTH domain